MNHPREADVPERPTICVLMSLDPDLGARLAAAGTVRFVERCALRTEKLAAIGDVDAVLVAGATTIVDAEFLTAANRLKVVSTVSVGYDHVDLDEATRRGILVCHTPGVLNEAVVDLTTVMIYGLARHVFQNVAYARDGNWAGGDPEPPLGVDIRGKTIGVIGFGRIGRDVTRRMQLLGMRTLWYDIDPRTRISMPTSEFRPLDELLAESDFVSLHANLNPGAPPIIGADQLSLMKPGAYLINTGRGGLVDQEALTEALRAGTIAGAALDVLAAEPPDPDEPILRLPNVVCLPHIGSATEETRRAMRELAVDNLISALAGDVPLAPVNPEVLGSRPLEVYP